MNAIEIAPASDVLSVTDVVAEQVLSTGFLIVIIAVHGYCLMVSSQAFSARFARMNASTPRWRVMLLMSITIGLLVLFHLVETLLWTNAIYLAGVLDDFRKAYLFVLEAYTTLGETSITLPEKYRVIGPMVAISGLFTFGWTGSALVYVMSQILRLEMLRARRAVKAGANAAQTVAGPFGT